MSHNFTLLIPTHNRPHYLKRALDYYQSISFKFLIVIYDSSKEKFAFKYPSLNIDYHHVPHLSYIQKMMHGVSKLQTPYSAICADDDFIIQSGIEKCISFLRENDDYVSVQGHVSRFMKYEEFIFCPDEFHAVGGDICHPKAQDRITYGVTENFIQTFFSIFKTKALQDIFKNANHLDYQLIEYYLIPMSYYFGKHKVLPFFYLLRENVPTSAGKSIVGIEQFAVYRDDKTEFNNLIKALDKTSKLGTFFFEDLYKKFILNFDPDIYKKEKNHKKLTGRFKKRMAPMYLFLTKFFKKKNAYKNEKADYKIYASDLVEKSKNIKGFPFYDLEAKKELEPILKQIIKHNII